MKPIGRIQALFVRVMRERGRFPASGSCWGTFANGERMAASVYERGLAVRSEPRRDTETGAVWHDYEPTEGPLPLVRR